MVFFASQCRSVVTITSVVGHTGLSSLVLSNRFSTFTSSWSTVTNMCNSAMPRVTLDVDVDDLSSFF